jgi:hypothetical protein
MTLYCEHGICHGFELLAACESVRHVFDLIVNRFEVAPSVIYYDRACQLHTFCLARLPYFFKDTTFKVDITHFPTHVGCSDNYNAAIGRDLAFHSSKDRGSYVNSQICEQTNSKIMRLRLPVGFMTQEMGLRYTRVYLARQNIRREDELKG